ncbi:MAG: hypothetical protein ACYTEZ_11780 [Planctomycetota bacterium]|jgi:chromosome segregation ATPase
MKVRGSLVALLVLACACGDKEAPPPAGVPKPTPAQQKRKDQEEAKRKAAARAQAREERIKVLKGRRDELRQQVQELQRSLTDLDRKHAEEKKGLPNPRTLRPYLMRLIRDSSRESSRLRTMERQFGELEQTVAEAKTTGELKALQDQAKEVEARYWKAHSGWMASLEDAKYGTVEESPVKRDLDLLRAVRGQWLRATPAARRGGLGAQERKIVNDGFRAWLGEVADRKRIVGQVISKSPDQYDFTDLEFYILLSIHELELDKQNIVLEKKELDENRVKLEAIEKELDRLREQIAVKLTEGGGDLEQYQDLVSRLPGQRTKAEDLQRRVNEYQALFDELDATLQRQLKEQEEAGAGLEQAEKELRSIKAELRKLGAR